MIENRSAPPGPIVPGLSYDDVPKAVEWLCGAFGFKGRLHTPAEADGTIHHTQLLVGEGSMILTGVPLAERDGATSKAHGPMVYVEDLDAHCERAKKFGAKIVNPPATHMFGERQYSAEDLAGYRWAFSQSVADVDPLEWGAQVLDIQSSVAPLRRPRLCYLEIPALDVHQSAAFYEKVFGCKIRSRDSARPSFDFVRGNVSGAFVTGRPISREPGLLPYIWVDGIDDVLARAESSGGEVVDAVHPDHPEGTCWIATFRDPAGNVIGLYQEAPR